MSSQRVLQSHIRMDRAMLKTKSFPVEEKDFKNGEVVVLLKQLWSTLKGWKGARGIAAIQIATPLRIGIMVDKKYEPIEMVNPEIIKTQGRQYTNREGCLSVRAGEKFIKTPRHLWIEASYMNPEGEKLQRVFIGQDAVCVQHLIDLMDGKLITDKKKDE